MARHGSNDIGARRDNPDTAARNHPAIASTLPESFVRMMEQQPKAEHFVLASAQAASEAGCEMLVELPPILIGQQADRVMAFRFEGGEGPQLFFLAFDAQKRSVAFLEGHEVSEAVLDVTMSYAGVLGVLAESGGLGSRPLH